MSEFQWMREYLMSVTFEERVKRRYVPERIWQAMLGCPSEIRTRNMVGCKAQQLFPSGQAVEPPGVLIADALVSWPQLTASTFSADAPYPSFFRTHNSTKVTFVGDQRCLARRRRICCLLVYHLLLQFFSIFEGGRHFECFDIC